MELLFPLILIGALFLPIILSGNRQRKRQAEVMEMQSNLQPDDRVVTGMGLYGTIIDVDGDLIELEISPGVVVTMERVVIARKIEPTNPVVPYDGTGDALAGGYDQSGESRRLGDTDDADVASPDTDPTQRRDARGDDYPENFK